MNTNAMARATNQAGRVHNRNHDDREQVVHHGQGQQEWRGRRHALAEHAQQRDCKRDVRSGRDCPTRKRVRTSKDLHQQVDDCRTNHAERRGDHWQCGLSDVTQGAGHELGLQFKSDDKEEYCEDAIRRPYGQGQV